MSNLNTSAAALTLPGDALDHLHELGISTRRGGDASVMLTTQHDRYEMTVLIQTDPGTPTPTRIDEARAPGLPVLVTAPHVSSRMDTRLRDLGLHYVDAAGNASIRLPGLVIEVHGRPKVVASPVRGTGPTRRSSGLRVLFALLTAPDRVKGITVRELAHEAGVSIGSAQSVMTELRADRFLHDGGLDRTAELFQNWVWGYLQDRRLQTPKARFTHEPGWHVSPAVDEAMTGSGAVLGGEDAATALGLPLRGSSGILYARASIAPVVKAARLRRDPEGTLQVRDMWWRPAPDAPPTAPTPLVYADLLASDDPRQHEIAAELRGCDALLRRLDEN